MVYSAGWALVAALLVTSLGAREVTPRPLLAVAGARLQEAGARLPPLSAPAGLDAIKKVAQILLLLGEQVVPPIIAAPPADCAAAPPADPVTLE